MLFVFFSLFLLFLPLKPMKRGGKKVMQLDWELWYLTWTGRWRKDKEREVAGGIGDWRVQAWKGKSRHFVTIQPLSSAVLPATASKSTLRMGLRDEETTKQTIVDTSRYRRGPCHECEGSSRTLLLCVPDKGQFVELNIFHRNRTCFQRVLRKQQLWGKKLQNGRCPYWPFQNWKSWVYSV